MEVGAVKQAYNNEVIHLKKKLNQTKRQIINKLIRKSKTLKESKSPEHVKEKLNRKAESAVAEILLLKRINCKYVARFAVIHKGELKDFLNKQQVDVDKACARLLLHKNLQDKYKLLRDRFSGVPIKDLFMSRQERLKLKKEAREQKEDKKGKCKKSENHNSSTGDWTVDDIEDVNDDERERDEKKIKNKMHISKDDSSDEDDGGSEAEIEHDEVDRYLVSDREGNDAGDNESFNTTAHAKLIKPALSKQSKNNKNKAKISKSVNDKRQLRKNKEKSNLDIIKPVQENKVIDPFFITSTGKTYMSLAEPRQADEIKEVHKEGNRKVRRAVMFGHVPKFRPQNDNNNTLIKRNGYKKDINVSSNRHFNNSNQDNQNNPGVNKRKLQNNQDDKNNVPEKLHPSWEAKKRMSGIQPFQGKKIVF